MFRKIFSIAIIFLCLWLISCGKINNPILPEEPTEKFFDGPIAITCDHGSYLDSPNKIIPDALRISRVLTESDLIFVGKISKVTIGYYWDIDIEIIEVLKGVTNEERATLQIGNASNYEIANDFREGNVCIICIRKDGDRFIFTTAEYYTRIGRYSVILIECLQSYNNTMSCWYEDLDDIKLLLNVYKKNKELFSKAGKRYLFDLYPQLKGSDIPFEVKTRFLYEIDYLCRQGGLDKQDIPVLLAWKKIETSSYFIGQIETIIKIIQSQGG